MQKIEVLNNIAHEQLRVNPKFSASMGDNVPSALVYVTEFSAVQKEYPILCRKNPESGDYQAFAFFGFEKDENLFLKDFDSQNPSDLGWNADYIPAVIARGPFSIGIQRETDGGIEKHNPIVHVDLLHPKINDAKGQILFLENGGHSPYLKYVSNVLDTINDGIHLTKLMFDAFNKYELLEDVVLDIEFQNHEKLKISGFETISVEKLSQLDGAALEELHKSGFLQAAYFIVTSMSNVRKLIDMKNRKL